MAPFRKNNHKSRYPCGVPVEQEPFEIPETWQWLRLGDVSAIMGGGTPRSGESSFWSDGQDIPWLTPADMRRQPSRYISRESATSPLRDSADRPLRCYRQVQFCFRVGHRLDMLTSQLIHHQHQPRLQILCTLYLGHVGLSVRISQVRWAGY